MKLVEILAQELEEWPDAAYCLTQDPNGRVYPWTQEPSFFVVEWVLGGVNPLIGSYEYSSNLASDYRTAIVTKDMWLIEKKKARIKRVTEPEAEWKEGVDLPPVGIECEHVVDTPWVWGVVKILAHTEVEGVSVALYQYGNKISFSSEVFFRKIDTKRQERENYIDRIYGVMCKADRPDNRSDMAEALYDAGLRFVEE